jgi:hypothetical protein
MFLNRYEKKSGDAASRSRRSGSKRSHRRYRDQTIAVEIITEDLGALPYECFDISPVGTYLHTEFLLVPGDEVNLKIRLSARHQPMDVVGEVVRVETGENGLQPGIGIAFTKIAKTDSKELKQFLMRRFLSNG